MSQAVEMKVRLQDLPVSPHIELPVAFVRDAISGLALRAALERPDDDPDAGQATADLELSGEADAVFATGKVKGWLEVACSRCVTTVRIELDEDVVVTYLPKERVPPDDDVEVEITEDDIDLFPYDGEEVDLEPLLRERLVLAIPYAPLCRTDCKGLCVQCGSDLNQTTCECQDQDHDPRLAPLRELALNSKRK
jgi:uncharacterized protein